MTGHELLRELTARGYQARIVSIEHSPELEANLKTLSVSGKISPAFYQELLAYYDFDWQRALPRAKSVVVMSAPQMPVRVRFGEASAVIPPTYIYRSVWEGSLKLMRELLAPLGHAVARARLPLKLLAVQSGLGEYGRSNICFVPGLGSFHRLGAFFTDVEPDDDVWRAPRLMGRCEACSACAKACPTGAIMAERVLIDAERCLTHMNEHGADFPAWVAPEWHNALIGCIACQRACPENRPFAGHTEEAGAGFSAEETALILARTPLESLPAVTRAKLHELCLEEDYPSIARNLNVLLAKPS